MLIFEGVVLHLLDVPKKSDGNPSGLHIDKTESQLKNLKGIAGLIASGVSNTFCLSSILKILSTFLKLPATLSAF